MTREQQIIDTNRRLELILDLRCGLAPRVLAGDPTAQLHDEALAVVGRMLAHYADAMEAELTT